MKNMKNMKGKIRARAAFASHHGERGYLFSVLFKLFEIFMVQALAL